MSMLVGEQGAPLHVLVLPGHSISATLSHQPSQTFHFFHPCEIKCGGWKVRPFLITSIFSIIFSETVAELLGTDAQS